MTNFTNSGTQVQIDNGQALPISNTFKAFASLTSPANGSGGTGPKCEIIEPLPLLSLIDNDASLVFRITDPDTSKASSLTRLEFNRAAGQPAITIPAGTIVETPGGSTKATVSLRFSRPVSTAIVEQRIPQRFAGAGVTISDGLGKTFYLRNEVLLPAGIPGSVDVDAYGTINTTTLNGLPPGSIDGIFVPDPLNLLSPVFSPTDPTLTFTNIDTSSGGVNPPGGIGGQGFPARTTVRFTHSAQTSPGGVIPAGTRVMDGLGNVFMTDTDVTVALNGTSYSVAATALTSGLQGNVAPGTIAIVIDPVFDPGFSVTNALASTGGSGTASVQFRTRNTVSWALNETLTLVTFADAVLPGTNSNVANGTLTVIASGIDLAAVVAQSITVTNDQAAQGGAFASALERVVIIVIIGSNPPEAVYDGTEFLGPYATSSRVDAVPSGLLFTVVRDTGWNATPLGLEPFAYDFSGNELLPKVYQWDVDVPTNLAPVISLDSPTNHSAITGTTSIVFEAEDPEDDLASMNVIVSFTGGGSETAYDGTSFLFPYLTSSTIVASGFNSTGKKITLIRDAGWLTDPAVQVTATDGEGSVTSVTYTFTHAVPGAQAPVTAVISPLPDDGSGTLASDGFITVNVTDADSGIRRCTMLVQVGTFDRWIEVYDGDGFHADFLGSTVSGIPNGFQFAIKYAGGWPPGRIAFRARVIDVTGLEAS